MPSIAKSRSASRYAARPMTGLLSPKWGDRSTFNVPEAAEILGIATRSCWEAVWKKELHSVKIGGRVIIPRQAIERLLAGA
jgi:excisionase family DNA binding protein